MIQSIEYTARITGRVIIIWEEKISFITIFLVTSIMRFH